MATADVGRTADATFTAPDPMVTPADMENRDPPRITPDVGQDAAPVRDAGPDASMPDATGMDAQADADASMLPSYPTCAQTCTAPADCVQFMGGLFDAENYACDMGACRWIGCISDQECVELSGAGYQCAEGAFQFATCSPICTVATDCAQAGTGAYDADNYACEAGTCVYQGCNNDMECQALGAGYVCMDNAVVGYPTCVKGCQVPADCSLGSPAYDADNYACTAGACEYLGCQSDAECAGVNPAFVCR